MLYDAHLHLQDERLLAVREGWAARAVEQRVGAVLVNGTDPGDWSAVLALAREHGRVLPSFGLHPWRVEEAGGPWREELRQCLAMAGELGRPVGIGEVGLDKWIFSRDRLGAAEKHRRFERQREAFVWQLGLAAEHNLPLSIHCLQAWGALREVLEKQSLPERGFLVHAYGGPPEYVKVLAELGAYFSFNAYFAREDKAAKLEAFRRVPPERLLMETDAPAMMPPEAAILFPLQAVGTGEALNHPGNLPATYTCASCCLGIPLPELTRRVADNFRCWLG